MGIWLDDEFYEHPKFEAAGDDAGLLWLVGMAYASRNKTGGHIPAAKAHRLTNRASKKVAEMLVSVNLWERTDTGYYIHDYPEHQRAAERRREEEAEKKRRRSEHARKAALARYGQDVGTDRAPPEQDVGSTPSTERAGGEQCSSHAGAGTRPNHLPSVDKSSSEPPVGEHAGSDDEEDPRIVEAAHIAARERLEATPSAVGNPEAWIAKTVASLLEHGAGVLRMAIENMPEISADALVDYFPKPKAAAMVGEPAPYTRFDAPRESVWADIDEHGIAIEAGRTA